MELVIVVFFVFVGIVMVGSMVVFGIVFFRAARFSGKVFDQVERELDQQVTVAEAVPPPVCQYCGSRDEISSSCSNCGAPLA